ncbi:MAG: Glycogen synthase [Candidatus Amesbacteria bacterium GW2011_GWB1_47_26]|uniref:Glycogen synthase n=1 Tax=Candidatus Amesbacteria bacterium GW2011_GWC2_45_19 TaxID=1618366 RepID=A0A0G1Q1D5_9BACT|nr:MAG: Glycogen synthase [Candidatus Amesbacteria bacterium GW2011_GWC2_45_19]KKU37986.1 MAG: Glycogen synthase [Candidatus Amesbacteria bacterium GW2011_GWA1_46_35]KKU68603.1 MAG: glycogen/starch synthase, ADP-glucose type, starch synthase [Microgenomates group bacterium GW2011_GWC1_47_20]KKU74565.1 MAG: Glycogen synthase [Candidatus Amesbacteria bacterium GW2011_GWB1_47_26]
MKVLFVCAEVAPFSAVGGLAQVAYFLPKALKEAGVDIRVFTPKYGIISSNLLRVENVLEGLKVPTGEAQKIICNVKVLKSPKKEDPIIYFLENMEYYEQRANVYNYSDDHIRFGLLSRAALEFVRQGDFVPDIIHVNDWHTGYLPNYLQTDYKNDKKLQEIATVFSIHNLHQGVFDFDHASEMDYDDGKGPLASFFSERFLKQNSLKRGIIHAHLINTVSQTYSRELLTEEYAPRLYKLFRELRGKFYGVLNGLDYQNFDPKKDKIIKSNYSTNNLSSREENKVDLQKEFNLEVSQHTPLLAIVGRLDDQKGLDLVMETIEFILAECNVQLVVCGPADNKHRDFFSDLEKQHPGIVGTHLMFDATLPRKIFAGADIILMPSKYEPGGIVALEALRYGCVPIVRATGGLADSVVDYDPTLSTGTGFSFKNYSAMSFLATVIRALETYKNKPVWKKIIKRAMDQDFSWDKSAKKYIDLYRRSQLICIG